MKSLRSSIKSDLFHKTIELLIGNGIKNISTIPNYMLCEISVCIDICNESPKMKCKLTDKICKELENHGLRYNSFRKPIDLYVSKNKIEYDYGD